MSDIVLQEGQVLLEAWHVEFIGKSRAHRPADKWIECRVVKMYHGTIYGGANGTGKTVEEARLNAVLGLARAICDDVSAFDHDAEEIFKAEQYRWWLSRIQEEKDILEEDYEEKERPKINRRAERRIKILEEQLAIWQEDHDYWPETDASETTDEAAKGDSIQAKKAALAAAARVRAAAASLAATAAAVKAARADT